MQWNWLPAVLKRAAFSLQLLLCPGMQLCGTAGCSAEIPEGEVPVPWHSPSHSPFPCVGLLPVPSSALSVGRAADRGSSFPFAFCWQDHIKKMKGSGTLLFFFLFLPGLQTSKLFEIYFPDFDVKVHFQCYFITARPQSYGQGLLIVLQDKYRVIKNILFFNYENCSNEEAAGVPVLWK